MEKKASSGEHFKERIALLEYFIVYGYLSENDVEEAYKKPDPLWKERIIEIEQKYNKVSICCIFNDRIGELIPRYIYAVTDKNNVPEDEIEIFFGVRGWCNNSLKKMLERNIIILDFSDKFWIYFILTYSGTISLDKMNKYEERTEYERIKFIPEQTEKLLKLTKEEIEYGKQKSAEIGIQEPFVCFSNRDAAYLNDLYPTADFSYHNHRDSHIDNYKLMAETLKSRNIKTVRMGKAVERRADFDNCIDFASDYYDELLDIYLMNRCKFFIGDESGINVLPRALNKPVVTTNLTAVTGYGGIPLREDNIFIFKKFYDIKSDRFLSLKEMCKILIECKYDAKEFEVRGIRLIENTPEEILAAVMEMNNYLDGIASFDEEGEYYQRKADDILKEHFEKSGLGFDETLVGKIGQSFLKNNKYLLE